MSKHPTVITLVLDPPTSLQRTASLVARRGTIAHLMTFAYFTKAELGDAIATAQKALDALEAHPPTITQAHPAIAPDPQEVVSDMLAVPLKKGVKHIPSHLLGEAVDETTLAVAGRLLDSGVWDGKSELLLADSAVALKTVQGFSDKELSALFTLTDFTQKGTTHETHL